MLPHNHFLIAGLVIAPISIVLFPENSLAELVKWILVGGILSASIDLDVYALVLLRSRKEMRLTQFINPLEIYRNFGAFMDTIIETGLWKIVLVTHIILSSLIILAAHAFSGEYAVPVTLGVASHILSDLPNLRRVCK